MKRKAMLFITFLLLIFLIVACKETSKEEAKTNTANLQTHKEDLVFVNFRDIRDLNPHLYAGEMYAQGMLYEPLVKVSENGVDPCLAEKWDISEDGRVYTFYIRKNVYFSDGLICDAHAIKANFDAIIENRNRHTWLEMMNLLKSVEVIDDYTFRITMNEPYYPMLIELGGIRPFGIISPASMKEGSTLNGVKSYVGTGAYILTDFVTDEYAIFEVNQKYWGKQPAIKKITVKVISDNQTRIFALQKNEIDLIYGKNMLGVAPVFVAFSPKY